MDPIYVIFSKKEKTEKSINRNVLSYNPGLSHLQVKKATFSQAVS